MSYYILNIKRRCIHYQTSQSYSPAGHSSIQKFDNDYVQNVIEHSFHGFSIKYTMVNFQSFKFCYK